MSWWGRFVALSPLRLLRRRQDERDLDDEIRFDLTEEARLHMERGESAEAGRTRARREFGNAVRINEDVREAWGGTACEAFGRDLRFATRLLAKSPGFPPLPS